MGRLPDFTPEELAELERQKRASFGQVLLRAARLLNARALERLRAGGAGSLSAAHTALLPHLDLGGTRLTVLAERVGITKQAVGQLVEDLEQLGVVKRTPDPEDRRAKRVRFTRKGFDSLLQGLAVLREVESGLEAQLGRRKVEALHALLGELLQALEREEPPGARRP